MEGVAFNASHIFNRIVGLEEPFYRVRFCMHEFKRVLYVMTPCGFTVAIGRIFAYVHGQKIDLEEAARTMSTGIILSVFRHISIHEELRMSQVCRARNQEN